MVDLVAFAGKTPDLSPTTTLKVMRDAVIAGSRTI